MSGEAMWDLMANILVSVAWLGCTLFILFYRRRPSRWRATLPGRTLMYSKLSMWALLSHVLWARWTDPPDLLRNIVAVGILASIACIQWNLFTVLRLVQTGRVSLDRPNYTPVRDWLRRRAEDRRAKPGR